MRKKTIWILALAAVALTFAGSLYFLYSPSWVYEIKVNGATVGYLNSLKEYQDLVRDIHAQAQAQWNCDLVMNETVTATRARFWSAETSPEAVRAGIESVATYTASGWAIVVNGETVALVDSEETAQDILAEVEAHYQPKTASCTLVSCQIQEDIRVEKRPISPELVMERDAVLALLLSGQEEISTYVVQRGDTLSGIARSYNTSVARLRDANPDVKGDTIQVGQVLNLEMSSAILHVKTVEEVLVNETIQKPVVYQANPDMTVREDKVIQAGANGAREVLYQVEKINGVEVQRKKLSTTITRHPVSKIVMTGIGYWPARPTGMFRFPLNQGRISSPFGNRKSGFHRGVDIATARGTPIYAAASGTVRTRGYSSSYGYYIVLEHSDGYSTLYAHVSSIADSVRVGKQVVRGQVIAWVGSTGFSTGPHLHWEVSRHGQLVNPMNFFGN
ncbi:MAG: peptidoglycan DD-metalloendopeptidase family protein [Bacillota bacterium]|jgi:murein DD-endopeptidase MepM/ murein hydrolase activator NlpD